MCVLMLAWRPVGPGTSEGQPVGRSVDASAQYRRGGAGGEEETRRERSRARARAQRPRTRDDAVIDALLQTLLVVHLALAALGDEKPSPPAGGPGQGSGNRQQAAAAGRSESRQGRGRGRTGQNVADGCARAEGRADDGAQAARTAAESGHLGQAKAVFPVDGRPDPAGALARIAREAFGVEDEVDVGAFVGRLVRGQTEVGFEVVA